jgi:hypothetical protein
MLHKATLVQSTGVEFPEVTTLWDGDKMRSVGAGVRAKKFGFLPIKVLSHTAVMLWCKSLLHEQLPDGAPTKKQHP